jgi:serine/threonine-protein kinase
VLDFGLAKMFQASGASAVQTAAGVLLGTPQYMSPEACESKRDIDHRTDIYALGVLLFQMLTGRLPFDGGILATVDDGTTQHVPTEVHCPDVPPELTKLVYQMIAYDCWHRASAAEVFTELSWLADAFAPPARSASPMTGMLRIRRPRWTPAISFGTPIERAVPDSDGIPTSDEHE